MSVRLTAIILLFLVLCAHRAYAQTETPTVTPTPEIYVFWTQPAPSVEGTATPAPGQDLLFGYEVNAGDVGIMLFLALIFFALTGLFLTTLALPKGK